MTSMNVSLPEELKEYVETQTRQGYSTPSEYVRELIREDQKRRARKSSTRCCLTASTPAIRFRSTLNSGAASSTRLSPNLRPAGKPPRRNEPARYPTATGAARLAGTVRLPRRAKRRGTCGTLPCCQIGRAHV